MRTVLLPPGVNPIAVNKIYLYQYQYRNQGSVTALTARH